MNKNLLFTLLLTLMSYAVFQPVATAASVELVPSSRVILKITESMTIDDIIRRVYPKDKDLWPQIKQKLIESNPNSFVQYSDRLIPGLRLKLVDIKRIYEEEELTPKIKVGYVAQLGGSAIARDINGRVQHLSINSQIFEGDRLETEIGARLYILMDDGAEVHLKEDSVLKISEYVITAGYDKNSSSILDLLRGGLRKITGSIGASALANYQVQTGLATIGIRGTEYVIKLCKDDDCTQTLSRNDPGAKLHAVVLKGSITLTTDEDVQILMAMGEYGTATPEVLVVEDEAPIPVGFLDVDEAQQFNANLPQKVEQPIEKESSDSTWMWVVGLLLLAVGI
ncbi:MAG: FecR domain-containing protein [Gammaproteobacteria bacterium]|nr:FecR domain-containing protein [Gammaproteobacteria bacterium]